ncbi:unnamed protein product [Aureobasidium pullulans]|nr:unnamed protein product [Aureobasidium pullulans]
MFHCHNLIHEDHDMMAALNVTHLTDLGYDEKTSFIDPMDTKYRAKSFKPEDLTNRDGDFEDSKIEEKCRMFQDLDAYKKANEVEEKLVEYWKTKSTLVTKVSSSGGGGSFSSSSGSGSVSASATVVSSSASVSSGSSVTPSSTLVTSANKASSTSTTKTTSSSTKSDDKGGKSKTSSSSTKK